MLICSLINRPRPGTPRVRKTSAPVDPPIGFLSNSISRDEVHGSCCRKVQQFHLPRSRGELVSAAAKVPLLEPADGDGIENFNMNEKLRF